MYILKIITYALVIIGALNWGLVGLLNINLISLLFGDMTLLARIVYILVGLSGIIYLFLTFKCLNEKHY